MSDIERIDDAITRRRGPDDSPGILLWRTANAWQRDIRGVVKARGLTQAQFVLMLGLRHLEARTITQPLPTTQQALAKYCGVDTTMASQVLRQLEADGHLRRAPGTDARSRALYLTDRGRQTISDLEPEVGAVDAKFFAALGDNAEMFKAALQVLIGLPPRLGSSRRSG
ncbi:MAG: DNA-binding MarR family transcriptional regulator [Alphaproteobacteria bacterium]|jgi:DNA-binding MarR family transcriptional regulator